MHLFGAKLCTAASVAGVAVVGDFGAIEHAAISIPKASGAAVLKERRVGFRDMAWLSSSSARFLVDLREGGSLRFPD